MKRTNPLQRKPLPKAYLTDLENRVFGDLAIEPERTKSRSLRHYKYQWTIAASLFICIGSYFFFENSKNQTELIEIESAQIADYLTSDYEANIFIEQQLGILEDPFSIENNVYDLDHESVINYLTEESPSYWINQLEENEK